MARRVAWTDTVGRNWSGRQLDCAGLSTVCRRARGRSTRGSKISPQVPVHQFRATKSPDAAQRAIQTIRQGAKALSRHFQMGRPVEELEPEFREWVIEFGQSAYVARYHNDGNQVVILAVRHAREAGY
ncbi:MAG: type II toxin-antitoxin system RelE/ParE family toxin [Candidatus Solibacter sp.]